MQRFIVTSIVWVQAESRQAARDRVGAVLRDAFGDEAVEPGSVFIEDAKNDYADRLEAAWRLAAANPESQEMAQALQAVADERPETARYLIKTFEVEEERDDSTRARAPNQLREDNVSGQQARPRNLRRLGPQLSAASEKDVREALEDEVGRRQKNAGQ
jgi:hypothetical protein